MDGTRRAYSGPSARRRPLADAYGRGLDPARLTIPGMEAFPTFRGRVLYLPLYRRTTLTSYGANIVLAARGSRLGFVGSILAVTGQVVANASSFMSSISGVVSAVMTILSSIVNFVIDAVLAVVTAVLDAASGLLGAVFDAIGLKGDGDLSPAKAAELAALLAAKRDTLAGHQGGLNRPMTDEEKAGYARNLADADEGIAELSGASKIVAALGGPVGTVAVGAAAAFALFMAKKR